MSEVSSPSDKITDIQDFVHVPTSDVPERYAERLATANAGSVGRLLTAMGLVQDETGVQIPTSGVKVGLEKVGLSPQFDFKAVDHVIDPSTYLEMIELSEAPLGDLFHDFVFHGVGFIAMDKPIADVAKKSASRARQTNSPDVMGRCVDIIDALSASYFGSEVSDNQDILAKEIAGRLRELAKICSVSVAGEDMITAINASKEAEMLTVDADAMGHASAIWFNHVLESV